jgi:4'-phosphopantetheinyl transferase
LGAIEAAYGLLSPEEQERADRLGQSADQAGSDLGRSRFIWGRAQLRQILSDYLNQPAGSIALSSRGKPMLLDQSLPFKLQFNLSHCQNRVIYSISDQPIGIDLEQANRPIRAPLALARRFFDPEETAAIAALAPEQQPKALLQQWVCKEATIKAQGKGLAGEIQRTRVQLQPQPQIVGSTWQLQTLRPDADHLAAIVTEGPIDRLRYWLLDGDESGEQFNSQS